MYTLLDFERRKPMSLNGDVQMEKGKAHMCKTKIHRRLGKTYSLLVSAITVVHDAINSF